MRAALAAKPSPAAYHEAGHAVAAVVGGFSLREVALYADGGGCCTLSEPASAVDLLAGGIAERIAAGSIPGWAWAQDRARAAGVLERAGRAGDYDAAMRDAEGIVADGWSAVEALASALQRAGRLTGDEAFAIIGRRLPEHLWVRAQLATLRQGLAAVSRTLEPLLPSRAS